MNVHVPKGPLAALMVNLLRLPTRGKDVRVQLKLESTSKGDRWVRRFGDRELVTDCRIEDDLFIERNGRAEVTYRLIAEERTLRYEQLSFRIAGVVIPPRLAPLIFAQVSPDPPGWRVVVSFRLPLMGVICSYEGIMVEE